MMMLDALNPAIGASAAAPAPTSWVVTNSTNTPAQYACTSAGGGWAYDGNATTTASTSYYVANQTGWIELTYPAPVSLSAVYIHYTSATRFGTISALNNGAWVEIATGAELSSMQIYDVSGLGLTSVTKLRVSNEAGHEPPNGGRLHVGEFYAL